MKKSGRTKFGLGLEQAMREAVAHARGELVLPMRRVDPLPKERIKAIRKKVAKSTRDFEHRFGIPKATIENYEQGRRKPDLAARILLRVIEEAPQVVSRIVAKVE